MSERWVIVDTETTGLNPDKDGLLAIGAVAMTDGHIRPQDRFERGLRYSGAVSLTNTLIHGIGSEQRGFGEPIAEVLNAWDAWAGNAPRFAFHAEFDRRVMRAARQRAGLAGSTAPWTDVAQLVSARHPRLSEASLDTVLSRFGLVNHARHSAGADAWATAELLMRLLAEVGRPQTLDALRLAIPIRPSL